MYTRISATCEWDSKDTWSTTYFNSSSDLLFCSALARAIAPTAAISLDLRLQRGVIRHKQPQLNPHVSVTMVMTAPHHQRSQ